MLPLIKVLSSLECFWFKSCFEFSFLGFLRVLVHWKIGVFILSIQVVIKNTTQCAKVILCWTYPGVLWSQRKICVDQHFLWRGGSLWGRVCCRKADPQNVAPKNEVGSNQNAATYPNASHLVLPIAGDCRTSWTKASPLDKQSRKAGKPWKASFFALHLLFSAAPHIWIEHLQPCHRDHLHYCWRCCCSKIWGDILQNNWAEFIEAEVFTQPR